MNIFQIQLLLLELMVFISLSIAIAPQRGWPLNIVPGDLPTTDLPAPARDQQDVQETLDELERETFRKITEHELTRDNRQYTPHKCCKIGKKVADKGLFCTIDLMQVEKKNNQVYRRKMKFLDSVRQDSDVAYKSLMTKVEKCYPNKASRSMFSKCCEWQLQINTDVDNCKYLESREARRECKQRVRARDA
ncbi:uncharacterized protein LOC121422405 [Lytechinus variegatus]|uniref:uncharacterized protein LOC121422405 n=1 Tax=Lytechinus variegatus TaxID=7654 RepID=UPI001BB140D9|nr:uncharacterized protein LOC121422405 [Lytechinus variegatus]